MCWYLVCLDMCTSLCLGDINLPKDCYLFLCLFSRVCVCRLLFDDRDNQCGLKMTIQSFLCNKWYDNQWHDNEPSIFFSSAIQITNGRSQHKIKIKAHMEFLREVASFNPQKAVSWRKLNAFSVRFYHFIQLSNFDQAEGKKVKLSQNV